MKNKIKQIFTFLIFMLFLFSCTIVFGQEPPPPPSHGSSGNQSPPGGGAPIGEGLVMLLVMGAAYGGKKLYQVKNSLDE